MDKILITRKKKVSNSIPDHLAPSILSNLSMKSLKRFECVCKSWALLFQTPYFISLFHRRFFSNNHSYHDDTSILLYQAINDNEPVLYSLSGERFENRAKIDWPNPLHEDNPKFQISGSSSINGIFCLISYFQPNIRVVLWNPATQELKVVPTSPIEFESYMNVEISKHGFGYDCVRDDYKVIRRVLCSPKSDINVMLPEDTTYDPFWEIYNLRSNSWRKLKFDFPVDCEEKGVCLNGVFHWWGLNVIIDDEDDEAYLLSFDLSIEVFYVTPILLGEDSFDSGYVWRDLMVLNGSIALISNYSNLDTFHIFILGELGVKESWFKLFIVRPLACIECPIGVGKNASIFFTKEDGKLVYFDLSTEVIEELNFTGDEFWDKPIIYKESLLSIEEMNM